jgi:hypothetical protein
MARQRWEYLAVPFKDAGDLKKNSNGLSHARLNELGADSWQAVGLSLKRGDVVAWPVVLLSARSSDPQPICTTRSWRSRQRRRKDCVIAPARKQP